MDNSPKKYQPSLALVFGYLLNIDRLPNIASEHHLNKRFSIAFDSHHPELGEMYFDIVMFENIFSNVLAKIEFDLIEMVYGENEKFVFRSFEDAIKWIIEMERSENEVCDSISIYHHENLVCYIKTEYYQSIGGPYPYHDTYNFACFMNQVKQQEIQELIEQTCERNEYLIRVIETGLDVPKHTLINRLKNLF